MPTSNSLVAAICLAVLGAVLAELIKLHLPEGFDPGYFTLVSAGVGVLVGWKIMGPKAVSSSAINNGITGVATLVVAGLAVFGAIEMLDRALSRRYVEPIAALEDIVTIGLEYALYLSKPECLVAMAIGAVVSGVATRYAYRRWG